MFDDIMIIFFSIFQWWMTIITGRLEQRRVVANPTGWLHMSNFEFGGSLTPSPTSSRVTPDLGAYAK